ncbi:MAG: DNA-formamidopyrimidine glycosylase family protein, partial [Nostocoides sp.]
MPEGHTLHRLAGALQHAFAGRPAVVTSPQGRFVEGAALLSGRVVEGAQAYGKHLFVHFAGEAVLHVHLGLIGSFDVLPHDADPPEPMGAVRVRMVNDRAYADLRGATLVRLATP